MTHRRGGGLLDVVVEYLSFLARAVVATASLGRVDVVHVHNPPDFLIAVAPQTAATPERDEFRIVYHGTVTPHYGVHVLFEAAAIARADLPHLTLEILGEGDALPAVEAAAALHGIADRLTLSRTYLLREEVLARVSRASVGVIPNLPTPLNRVRIELFDCVALGVPVVASGLREHFAEEEVLHVSVGNAAAFAGALQPVAADVARFRTVSRRPAAARDRALRRFASLANAPCTRSTSGCKAR